MNRIVNTSSRFRNDRQSAVVQVRPVRERRRVGVYLGQRKRKHSSEDLRVISEFPVAIIFIFRIFVVVVGQQVAIGVLVHRSAIAFCATRVPGGVTLAVRTIVRRSDGGVRANVDRSEDRVDCCLVLIPGLESPRLVS